MMIGGLHYSIVLGKSSIGYLEVSMRASWND